MTKVNEALVTANEYEKAIGTDDANNEFASTNVVANADGSLLERLESLKSAVGTGGLNTIIGALTDIAGDTTDTATVMKLLRQIAEAVNNGTGTSIATNKSLVDYIGPANASSLVARIGALTDVAADTTDAATIIALLRQIAEAINKGTGTAIAADKSLVDYIGNASSSSLIARLGALTDVADETADTATIMNLIRALVGRRLGMRFVSKTVTFNGEVSYAAFTVTGLVACFVVGYVTTPLTNHADTVSVGTATSAAGLIAATAGTAMQTAGQAWVDNAPSKFETLPSSSKLIGDGEDIAVVGTANIAAGVVELYCFWVPLSSDGNVVAG